MFQLVQLVDYKNSGWFDHLMSSGCASKCLMTLSRPIQLRVSRSRCDTLGWNTQKTTPRTEQKNRRNSMRTNCSWVLAGDHKQNLLSQYQESEISALFCGYNLLVIVEETILNILIFYTKKKSKCKINLIVVLSKNHFYNMIETNAETDKLD